MISITLYTLMASPFRGRQGGRWLASRLAPVFRIVFVIVRASPSPGLISACTCGNAGPDAPDPLSGDVRPVLTTAPCLGAAAPAASRLSALTRRTTETDRDFAPA
jgi:hypothetical protein